MARLPFQVPFDPNFLGGGYQVPLPTPRCEGPLFNGGEVLDYIYFSVVMHQDRRSALYTAHNIDMSQKRRARRNNDWEFDGRIPTQYQTGEEAYRRNSWDRGHLVRRNAVAWGEHAQAASDATFYFPNAAMQDHVFNTGKWLGLENWILEEAGAIAARMCVFTGPIYTTIDEEHRGYRIPSAFWKIIVLRDPTANGEDLSAVAFMMKQNPNWRAEGRHALRNLETYNIGINEIEAYTGLDFGQLSELDEFQWRGPRFRNRGFKQPILVEGPDDIIFSGNRRRASGMRAMRMLSATDALPSTTRALTTSEDEHRSNCGCSSCHDNMNLEQEVKSLKQQTTVLVELLEDLLEENQGNFKFKRGRMSEFRSRFARILNGERVPFGAYPECAAIGNDRFYFCSGVLVHPRVVLTAAHCAPDISRVFLNSRQIYRGGEVSRVQKVIIHPSYDGDYLPSHDIAIIILEEDAETAPVQIATRAEIDADDTVTLVGFGTDTPDGATGYGTKRKVSVPLTITNDLPPEEKAETEYEYGFDAEYEFHAGNVEEQKDSCAGDSGGPAYIDQGGIDNRRVAGLTSRAAWSGDFSEDKICGDGGIYTIIAPYVPWIKEVAIAERLDNLEVFDLEVESEKPPGIESKAVLYISAAQPNPSGPDNGHEWIEVTNCGESTNLEGYHLADRQGGQLPLTGNIAKDETRRFVIPEGGQPQLGNKGDDIILVKGGETIHQVSYPKAGSGHIFQFDKPGGGVVVPPDGGGGDPDPVLPIGADPC